MYQLALAQSYVPAQDDDVVLGTTVHGALQEAAHAAPDAPALSEAKVDGEMGRHWTYGQFLADVEKLAQALAARFAPGERVAVWAPNIPEWAILEFASAMAGLTLVTVNPAYQAKELHYVLKQSRSAGLFLVREFRGNPMAEIAKKVRAELASLRGVFDLEENEIFRAEPRSADCSAQLSVPINPDDAVQIQYTSGTTGFPKGAVLPHRGIVNNSRFTLKRLGVGPGDIYLNFMPMFHTAGCAIAMLGAVQMCCHLILAKQFDGDRMNAIIERERVGFTMGVPTMLIGMLEALERTPRDVSSIRGIMSGGAMVPPELARRVQAAYGCGVGIIYGQTETSPVLTQTRSGDSFGDQTQTIGQALPQTELSIRDIASNEVMPVGEVGEICSRGYCNMLGYNDNPGATAKTIDAEGWLHTGDLGTMDARGYLRVTGRVKDMIIRGGENLFPAEIENVLLEHPAVAEVAVVGVPDEKWGEIAVCFLRVATGTQARREDLVAHIRRDLAAQKTPAHWIVVDGFPLTASGKIQKFVLRERFVAGEFAERL